MLALRVLERACSLLRTSSFFPGVPFPFEQQLIVASDGQLSSRGSAKIAWFHKVRTCGQLYLIMYFSNLRALPGGKPPGQVVIPTSLVLIQSTLSSNCCEKKSSGGGDKDGEIQGSFDP